MTLNCRRLSALVTLFRNSVLVFLLGLFTARSFAQITLTAPVGTSSPTQTALLTFATAGTPAAIHVLTQGTPGLDFQLAASQGSLPVDCVINQSYVRGSYCAVEYTFTPAYAGPRYGAITLSDDGGNVLASTFVSGIGTGPQITFPSNTATAAVGSGFSFPGGVAVDGAGNVYVADTYNNEVKKIPYSGGSYGTPVTLGGGFFRPQGVAVDGAGNVYVADTDNHAVKEIPYSGGSYGTPVTLGSGFNVPRAIAVDAGGSVYVADSGRATVTKFPYSGGSYGSPVALGGGFSYANGVAVDGAGNVYVGDVGNSAVKEIPYSGGSYGTPVTLGGGFLGPAGVAVDGAGNVYVADIYSGAVKEIPYSGGVYGTPVTLGGGFIAPVGVAVDGAGNVFVADHGQYAALPISRIALADPPNLSFPTATGDGSTDTADGPQAVTVANIGNQPLDFFSPTPSISTGFSLGTESTSCVQLPGEALAAGGSCTLTASFAPVLPQSGAVSGAITLDDNNGNASSAQQSIPLSGTAIAPPSAPVLLIGFSAGEVAEGVTDQLTFTLSNPNPSTTLTGVGFSAALPDALGAGAVQSNTCSGGAAGGATLSLSGASLAGGSSCQIAFLFTPTAPGSFSVSATPTSSNGGSATTASNSVTVDPVFGPGASILSVSPSTALAGTNVTVSATVEDRYNNLIGGATVTFSAINSSTGMPSTTASFSAASGLTVNGVLASVLTDTVAEPLTITASVSGPVTGALQNSVAFVAPSYTVTTLVDPASGNGTPGNCVAAGLSGDNSNCSLRDAVAAANALSGVTAQIGFAPALTAGATTASPAILAIAQSTPITLSASMNINGPGANLLTIEGGIAPYNGSTQTANYQVFAMTGGTSMISGVTVANGYYSSTGNGGGGMRQTGGALTVSNSTFSGNYAPLLASDGGAINATGKSLKVSNSTFSGNYAFGGGGAINAFESAIIVSGSTFSGNSVVDGGGGAIFANRSAITVSGSTFSGNSANSGGAILAYGGSSLNASDSIFTGNSAVDGGAVYVFNGAATAAFTSSVFYGNTAYNYGNDCEVLDGTCTFTNEITGNPNLSPLGYYGGPTQTMLPLPGSSAICAGVAESGVTADQRGFEIPATYGGTECYDAGAVQTHYALAFAKSPGNTTLGQTLSPAPAVAVSESGSPLTAGSATVTLTDGSGALAGTTVASTSTATGQAAFANLSVGKADASDSLTATLSLNPPLSLTAASGSFAVGQGTPVITWPAPAAIVSGTALSATQLDATATFGGVPLLGSFKYSPAAGTVLGVGANQTLSVTFTPTDTADYATVNGSATITVNAPAGIVTLGISNQTQTYQQWTNFVIGPVYTGSRVPTGTVTLYDNGVPVTTQTLGGDGKAYYTAGPFNVGANVITATYSGDKNFPAGVSAPVTITVLPAPVNFQASCWGGTVWTVAYQCTVSVSASTTLQPGGNITYSLDGAAATSVALASGAAAFTVPTLPAAGAHKLTINYAAQGNFAAGTTITKSFTTAQGATALQIAPSNYNPATGSSISITGTASTPSSGVPAGSVTIYDNNVLIGTAAIGSNGAFTYPVSNIAKGSHSYYASYAGSTDYAAAKSATVSVTAH